MAVVEENHSVTSDEKLILLQNRLPRISMPPKVIF